ncbi:MAG: AMP-binding protein, partial [Promethearchaeia archaeon]
MYSERFWMKNWDEDMKDLDPKNWEKTFVEAIAPSFEDFPEKIALTYLGVEITFGELDDYSNQFANMLIEHGFKKGDIIGINLPNIPECVIAYIGTFRAGCVASGISPLLSDVQMEYQLRNLGEGGKKVGLVTLDVIYQARVIKIAQNLAQLELIITTNIGQFLPRIKRFLGKLLKKIPSAKVEPLSYVKTINFIDAIENQSTIRPEVDLSPEDIALILFTGGTTGEPKGVVLTHRNVVCDVIIVSTWLGWERGKGSAVSGFPFFHMGGLYFLEHCLFLAWGQSLIPNPRDIDYIVKQIKKY